MTQFRRVLLNVSGDFLFGLSVAAALGLDGGLGGFLQRADVSLQRGRSFLVPRFFD